MPDSTDKLTDTASRLAKIETQAPKITLLDMENPVQLVLGVLRIKDLAKQLNIWDYIVDSSIEDQLSTDDATVFKRWLCNAFECRDTRALISRQTTPAHCWKVIEEDVLTGNPIEEVVHGELQNLSWDATGGNIISFNSKYHMLIDELKDLKGETLPLNRLKKIYGRAMPERYQSIVQIHDSAEIYNIADYVQRAQTIQRRQTRQR